MVSRVIIFFIAIMSAIRFNEKGNNMGVGFAAGAMAYIDTCNRNYQYK